MIIEKHTEKMQGIFPYPIRGIFIDYEYNNLCIVADDRIYSNNLHKILTCPIVIRNLLCSCDKNKIKLGLNLL